MKKLALIFVIAGFVASCGDDHGFNVADHFDRCEAGHRFGNAPMECAFSSLGYLMECGVAGNFCHY